MTTVANLMNLKGRKALVTGATGGIGCVIASTLAELGADLLLVDRPGSEFQTLVQNLESKWGVVVQVFECDLEIQEERDTLYKNINQKKTSLEILVNNAAFVGTSGLQGWVTDFEQQTIDTWRRALEVNLTAAFDLSKILYVVPRCPRDSKPQLTYGYLLISVPILLLSKR